MKRLASIARVLSLLIAVALVATLAESVAVFADHDHGPHGTFDLVEASIDSIHQAFDRNIITPEQLVKMYWKRIAAYDGKTTATHLNAYMYLNPRPLAGFDEGDAQGRDGDDDGHGRQPLWGIPIILKDNVDTRDMPTTAGSVALVNSFPRTDAFVARRLREAGAIILGKATMTEFANFLTNGMPAGYSSHGGYGFNPFDPRPDPRTALDSFGRPFDDGRPALTPGGSSSGPGISVTANLATVGIGTETSGSILSPGTANGVVGIKPTVGLVSRDGVVPIAADQDTAGPFGRTVRDAAIVLGVIAGFDPNDSATAACLTPGNCFHDYTKFLDKNALKHARIAVPPFPSNRADVMNAAIAVLKAQGATVDLVAALGAQLPSCASTPLPSAYPPPPGCSTVLNYAFKRDLNKYFAAHVRASYPRQSLADVIAFNDGFGPGATKYGQDLALFSQLFDTDPGSPDTLRYQSDRAQDIALSRGAIHAVLDGADGKPGTADDYDALLFSGSSGAGTPAKAGYPSIVVPGGFFQNVVTPPFPDGFNAKDGPTGVTFSAGAFSEPRLIALAYAFEQATHHRVAPPLTPALPSDHVSK